MRSKKAYVIVSMALSAAAISIAGVGIDNAADPVAETVVPGSKTRSVTVSRDAGETALTQLPRRLAYQPILTVSPML